MSNKPPLDIRRAWRPGSSGGVKVAPFIRRRCQNPLWTADDQEAGACQFAMTVNPAQRAAKNAAMADAVARFAGLRDTSARYLGSYLIKPTRNALATAWVRLTVSSFLVAQLQVVIDRVFGQAGDIGDLDAGLAGGGPVEAVDLAVGQGIDHPVVGRADLGQPVEDMRGDIMQFSISSGAKGSRSRPPRAPDESCVGNRRSASF